MLSNQQDSSNIPKCVVIGDACVGKTCMVACLAGKKPDLEKYDPTFVENLQVTVMYKGQQRKLDICDTAGQEDFEYLRTISYANTDLFLLCFSLVDRNSFENLEIMWMPELQRHRGKARLILVGTKMDLCRPGDKSCVSRPDINTLRSKLSVEYVQCSSLSMEGIQDVLDKSLEVLFGAKDKAGQSKRKRRCNIM